MPPLLKDSERGGREGSEGRLGAGELCLFILDRSSTWERSHTSITHRRVHGGTQPITNHPPDMHPVQPSDRLWTFGCQRHDFIDTTARLNSSLLVS